MAENDMAKKIRDLRIAQNLTLEQVANQVGVGKSTVRKWETGMIANMRRDKIASLAKALHTTPAYLMGWEDDPIQEKVSANEIVMSIGEKIKKLRLQNGLSQADLGKIVDVTDKAVSTWENDIKIPRMETIEKIARYFGVSKAYLVDGNETETITQADHERTMYALELLSKLSKEKQEEALRYLDYLTSQDNK